MVVFDDRFAAVQLWSRTSSVVQRVVPFFTVVLVAAAGFASDEALEVSPDCSLADALAQVDVSAAKSVEEAQLTVLVFLNVDCPIANRYAPELRKLAEDYGASEVVFLRVYSDAFLADEDLAQHAADYDLPWQGLLDRDFVLATCAGARVTPEVAVFDAAGALAYRGRIDDQFADLGVRRKEAQEQDLREALDAVLAGNTPPKERTKALGCYIPYPRPETSTTTE